MSLWKVSNPLYGEDFPARWVEAPNESMALLQAPTPGYSLRTLTDMGWRAEPFEARPSGEHADLVRRLEEMTHNTLHVDLEDGNSDLMVPIDYVESLLADLKAGKLGGKT